MNFQIEQLIIWPRNKSFTPRIIDFTLNKVNVITGSSRTGKTAIIPIIDYCLGSKSCYIPIEIIRDTASWYGIVIVTNTEKILLARKVPDGSKASTDFYYHRGPKIATPPFIEESNETLDGIKLMLNSIAGLPYIHKDNQTSGYDNRLSFRDITHLVFQSQDIIANQGIMFYKTHMTEHREKLKRWFPYIIGAETAELINAKEELKQIKSELTKKEKEYAQAKNVSEEWLNNVKGNLRVFEEYGLYEGTITNEYTQDELLTIAKEILEKNPDTIHTTIDTITKAREEMQKIEVEEANISEKIAIIKKRQKDIEDLEKNITGFQDGLNRKIKRLGISDWFRKNMQPAYICPLCGSKEHHNANNEIEKICKAVESYEKATATSVELPAAFLREKEDLKVNLKKLTDELSLLQNHFDLLRIQDEETAKDQQRRKNMYMLLGQLRYTVNLIETLSDSGSIELQINQLKNRKKELEIFISNFSTKNRQDIALEQISQLTLERLKTLDVDPKYKEICPEFSIQELTIVVKDMMGNPHLLSEIGSASNWLAFHIALTCALQEFFCKQSAPISSVPSFIVYDQPSQVYFPKLYKNTNIKHDETEPMVYDEEDSEAVKAVFKTLALSIKQSKEKWQAIVLDHAGSDIYDNIDGVTEVEEWRRGKKLIPENWYTNEKGSNLSDSSEE